MKHNFDHQNQEYAKKTYRSWSHNTPVCYKLIFNKYIDTSAKRILDYGCGTDEKYVEQMIKLGLNAVGIDFHIEGSRDKHLGDESLYDIIIASNVLNVMNNLLDLEGVIQEIAHHLAPQGQAIINYPVAPRKLGLSNKDLVSLLEKYFILTKPDKIITKKNFIRVLTQ